MLSDVEKGDNLMLIRLKRLTPVATLAVTVFSIFSRNTTYSRN